MPNDVSIILAIIARVNMGITRCNHQLNLGGCLEPLLHMCPLGRRGAQNGFLRLPFTAKSLEPYCMEPLKHMVFGALLYGAT